ncbi:peptidase S28, partial [Globomyces pollinis-pini]
MNFRLVAITVLGLISKSQALSSYEVRWNQLELEFQGEGKDLKNAETESLLADPQFQYFTQRLDHFNADDKNLWKQRYYTVEDFYKPGGPVFFENGGEGEIRNSKAGVERMLGYELAKKYNGAYIVIEHRYYGTSLPTADYSIPNLKWLNVDQALEDSAYFIKNHQLQITKDSKWIAIGGSYPGNIAAWMRLKFPDLIYAAHSSSGPVLAKADFWRYGFAVDYAIGKIGNQACANGWNKAIAVFDKKSKDNVEQVQKDFAYTDDVRYLALELSWRWATLAQYGPRYFNSTTGVNINGSKVGDLDAVCSGKYFKSFSNPSATEQELYNDLAKFFIAVQATPPTPGSKLMALPNSAAPATPVLKVDDMWTWQFCTEFGYLQAGSKTERSAYSSLILPDDIQQIYCQYYFGADVVKPQTDAVNAKYKGLDVHNAIDRILFVNGEYDPWRWLSVVDGQDGVDKTKSKNEMILIPQSHHCNDLFT